jgi:hypothetical protein
LSPRPKKQPQVSCGAPTGGPGAISKRHEE